MRSYNIDRVRQNCLSRILHTRYLSQQCQGNITVDPGFKFNFNIKVQIQAKFERFIIATASIVSNVLSSVGNLVCSVANSIYCIVGSVAHYSNIRETASCSVTAISCTLPISSAATTGLARSLRNYGCFAVRAQL